MALTRKEKVEKYYSNKIELELVMDNVHDLHNVAAVSRTADALGIRKIHLYYTYNKFPNMIKKGKKSSSSANKWVKFEKVGDLKEFVSEKKKEGYSIVGADYCKDAIDLRKFDFSGKVLVVFGNEHQGISEEVKKVCDRFVFIPMTGMVESLNISVAAAIVMYEAFRQNGDSLDIREKLVKVRLI